MRKPKEFLMQTIDTLFLVCSHFHPTDSELSRLSRAYPQLALTIVDEDAYTEEQIARAHIIVGFPKPDDLKKALCLRWLQTPSAGVQQYVDTSLYADPRIVVTNAVGAYGRQISDHVIGTIIAFNHHLLTYHDQMKERLWKRYFPVQDLWESTILVLGLGDIGTHVAKKAKMLGMYVIAVKRTMTDLPSSVDELHTTEQLDALLPRADYVVLCLASTPQTEHILDAHRIALMKQGAYLCNVARGSLIDHQALEKALQSGHLGGAALDVTEPEPLPQDSLLWSMPNVLITPHASGLSPSNSSQVFELFFDNLGRYLAGQKMKHIVDFEQKY